ncbi:MAG: carotenoid biosynthesis protein [Nitrospirota bacterium]
MILWDTILLRPYVFAFLLVYLIGCTTQFGLKRTLLFCVTGYLLAWISEFSSIHTGFPYGWYYYIEHTKGQELWVFGVPFMDSLSYVFLIYASYSLAIFILSPLTISNRLLYVLETRTIRKSWHATLLATVLFVYLDIIIDPVALQGYRWFLGQIYGYQETGVYFGIPLSNFGGWFVVGFLMVALFQGIDHWLHQNRIKDFYLYPSWRFLIGPGLYFGIVLFNLFITFFIGEYLMGWAGIFIYVLSSFLLYTQTRMKLASSPPAEAFDDNRRDFPEARLLK